MADGRKYILLAVLLAALCCREPVSHEPHQRLDRPTGHITSSGAVEHLQHARTLRSEDVERLIGDFAAPENRRAFQMEWGLYTGHTPETDILLAHAEQSHDALLRALRNPNIHIRRYSAFTLAEMHRASDFPALQEALRREIAASAPSQPSRAMNPALAAIVRACAALHKRETISWLLAIDLPSPDAIAAANEQVRFLLPFAPRCGANETAQDCRDDLKTYWKANSQTPDSNLFR